MNADNDTVLDQEDVINALLRFFEWTEKSMNQVYLRNETMNSNFSEKHQTAND